VSHRDHLQEPLHSGSRCIEAGAAQASSFRPEDASRANNTRLAGSVRKSLTRSRFENARLKLKIGRFPVTGKGPDRWAERQPHGDSRRAEVPLHHAGEGDRERLAERCAGARSPRQEATSRVAEDTGRGIRARRWRSTSGSALRPTSKSSSATLTARGNAERTRTRTGSSGSTSQGH